MPTGAIITADIVNSTMLIGNTEKKLTEQLSKVLSSYKYEFYRGDSFQVYIKDPKIALTVLLRLRLTARKFSHLNDIRAGIGIGKVDLPVRKLSTVTNEAFILSGRAFDNLSKTENRLIIECVNPTANHAFKVISYFVDYLLKGLTEKQAEVLFELIDNNTQKDTAKNLGKSVSTINKHAQTSGWYELARVIDEYKQLATTL